MLKSSHWFSPYLSTSTITTSGVFEGEMIGLFDVPTIKAFPFLTARAIPESEIDPPI